MGTYTHGKLKEKEKECLVKLTKILKIIENSNNWQCSSVWRSPDRLFTNVRDSTCKSNSSATG